MSEEVTLADLRADDRTALAMIVGAIRGRGTYPDPADAARLTDADYAGADLILGWLTEHDKRVAARALRAAVGDMRARWEGHWNLRDPRDPEVSYSVDVWLEVRADHIEAGGGS